MRAYLATSSAGPRPLFESSKAGNAPARPRRPPTSHPLPPDPIGIIAQILVLRIRRQDRLVARAIGKLISSFFCFFTMSQLLMSHVAKAAPRLDTRVNTISVTRRPSKCF